MVRGEAADSHNPPMNTSERGWERAERLDADRLVDALYTETGVRLSVEGPCPGGQVGAAYVRRPDGHRSVLKWRPRTKLADFRAGPLAVSEFLRAAGYPWPGTTPCIRTFTPATCWPSTVRSPASSTGDGAGRGDSRFDLVTLRFGLHAQESDPIVTSRLDEILDRMPDDVLRPLWAHMSLRMVDWVIRHFTPAEVEHWLDLAERRAW